MTRRPTRDEIALSAAITAHHARLSRRAEAAADFIVAVVFGALGACALLHYLTPCEAGYLCWAPIVIAGGRGARPAPDGARAGLLMRTWHRLAILCRRLQIRAVHVRLRQLELLACSQLLRVRRGHAVDSLQYARVLCRQSELSLHLKQLHALLAEHLAALQAPRSAPSTADDLGAC